MTGAPVVARHGPPGATAAVSGGSFGRRWQVAAVVEIWGARGPAADALARALGAALLAHARPGPPRSLTSALRAGFTAADARLRASGVDDPLLAVGLGALAWDGRRVLVAQAGPSLALMRRPGDAEPTRLPAASPWLGGAEGAPEDVASWPPLGWPPAGPAAPAIHWTSLAAEPGLTILLAATPAGAALDDDVARAALRTPAERGANALAAALPAHVPAVWFALPSATPVASAPRTAVGGALAGAGAAAVAEVGPPPATRAVAASRQGAAAGHADAAASPPVAPTAPGAADLAKHARAWTAGAERRLRPLAADALRTFGALLPTRPPEHARVERALAAAVMALAIPMGLAAITLLVQLRMGPELAISAPPPAAADDPGPVIDASVPGSPAVRRLVEVAVAAPLIGDAADPRALVVTDAAQYVLNRAQGRVERIAADAALPRIVVARGQAVGDETVGALEDLAWIPDAGGGGRVVALDAAGHLWRLDDGPRRIALSPPPALAAPARLAGADGRLYVLDRGGAIMRYTLADPAAATATEGAPWAQGVDLARAVDLAVADGVVVLDADGRLRRFVDGSETPLAVAGLDPPLGDPRAVYTAPAAGRLLVADHGLGRIVDLSIGGTARARLMVPPVRGPRAGTDLAEGRIPDLHDLWWDARAGTLWIVAGAALLRAPFDRGGG